MKLTKQDIRYKVFEYLTILLFGIILFGFSIPKIFSYHDKGSVAIGFAALGLGLIVSFYFVKNEVKEFLKIKKEKSK